jgi:hypothetical protein
MRRLCGWEGKGITRFEALKKQQRNRGATRAVPLLAAMPDSLQRVAMLIEMDVEWTLNGRCGLMFHMILARLSQLQVPARRDYLIRMHKRHLLKGSFHALFDILTPPGLYIRGQTAGIDSSIGGHSIAFSTAKQR